MKTNEKYNPGCKLRALSICAVFLACISTISCRSSRSTVGQTATVEHLGLSKTKQTDSIQGEQRNSLYQRGENRERVEDRGRVDIERDSAGRPTVIYWFRNFDFEGFEETFQGAEDIFTLRSSSERSDSSATADSVSQKKEETQTEVNATLPIETFIGLGIILPVILYVIYLAFSEILLPWIRRRRR